MKDKARVVDAAALIANVEQLLATRIFSSAEASGPLFKSGFVWLILNLDALLAEADRRGIHVDVDMTGAEGGADITALIVRARYSIVHALGGDRYRGGAVDTKFGIAVGEASGYEDDIAVTTGAVRVLIRRHAVTAFERVRDLLGANS